MPSQIHTNSMTIVVNLWVFPSLHQLRCSGWCRPKVKTSPRDDAQERRQGMWCIGCLSVLWTMPAASRSYCTSSKHLDSECCAFPRLHVRLWALKSLVGFSFAKYSTEFWDLVTLFTHEFDALFASQKDKQVLKPKKIINAPFLRQNVTILR